VDTKPFPWKCPSCHQREVRLVVVPYSATVEHDGRAYIIRIPNLEVPQCGNCGKLVMTETANQMVATALRSAAGLLLPDEIQQGRASLGLTQKQFADRLGVSDATVSRWETGGQIQQRGYDRMMRGFFEVPEFRRFLERQSADGNGPNSPRAASATASQ
jgi:putative zinc finger/helix-turn-helix YgiT family protein